MKIFKKIDEVVLRNFFGFLAVVFFLRKGLDKGILFDRVIVLFIFYILEVYVIIGILFVLILVYWG